MNDLDVDIIIIIIILRFPLMIHMYYFFSSIDKNYHF